MIMCHLLLKCEWWLRLRWPNWILWRLKVWFHSVRSCPEICSNVFHIWSNNWGLLVVLHDGRFDYVDDFNDQSVEDPASWSHIGMAFRISFFFIYIILHSFVSKKNCIHLSIIFIHLYVLGKNWLQVSYVNFVKFLIQIMRNKLYF